MEILLSSPPGSALVGAPIPSDPHALSVSLPTWQDNIGWAEGDAKVVDAMSTGYPRFFVHRNIQKLAKICLRVLDNKTDMAILFPTGRTAEECYSYMTRMMPGSVLKIVQFEVLQGSNATHRQESTEEVFAVLFPPENWKIAKSFWQHVGMGISSRYAETIFSRLDKGGSLGVVNGPLRGSLNLFPQALKEKRLLKRRIAQLINNTQDQNGFSYNGHGHRHKQADESHVYLYPTGMSAIWHAHQLSLAFLPDRKCICFGFSYTDTIKVLERWGSGSVTFFEHPDSNLEYLEKFLPTSPVSGLFCEVPSNPLLQTPNLLRLRALADKYGFMIIVDETVGNFVNVDVFKFADVVTTSLSKLFSGSANVMGGSLVINPNSPHYHFMRTHLESTFVDDYYHEDAVIMEVHSRNFATRVSVINANAVSVCEYLRSRSLAFAGPDSAMPAPGHGQFAIKDVFYPKWVTRANYDLCRRAGADNNFGPLLSLTFVSSAASHAFYNALPCAKGPSLGTNFTLACPYTILAHYNERPWAAEYGVEEGIVRISVGMEQTEVLMSWVATALAEAERAGSQ